MSWKLYAQRRLRRERNIIGGNLFYAFGTLARAHQGAGDGVSEVEIDVDRHLGTYWGWLPRNGERPLYICDSQEDLAVAFSCGDRTRQIQDAVRCGRGQILQLHARTIQDVT